MKHMTIMKTVWVDPKVSSWFFMHFMVNSSYNEYPCRYVLVRKSLAAALFVTRMFSGS
jgi:hypothetical protein